MIATTGKCDDDQIESLARYRDWLSIEAARDGGIGPAEIARLDRRHIADSLLFLFGLDQVTDVLDVGSGVGLPGIPLAIARPQVRFRLLDRSGRRVALARRAKRVLDIDNVEVVQGDFNEWTENEGAIVSRAAIPPQSMRPVLERVLSPGGLAILGGSWTKRPVEEGFETKEVGAEILDHTVWILMMRQT
jgi:16S rRNA (guanine527-N7)-methyltransferase